MSWFNDDNVSEVMFWGRNIFNLVRKLAKAPQYCNMYSGLWSPFPNPKRHSGATAGNRACKSVDVILLQCFSSWTMPSYIPCPALQV